jgi:serine protease Do
MKRTLLATMLLATLILVTTAGITRAAPPDPVRRTPVVIAVEKASPSVVNISAKRIQTVRNPFFDRYFSSPGRRRIGKSIGSGVVIHASGYVVTNRHVVNEALEIMVGFEVDGTEEQHSARLVAEDPINDLALLKVDSEGPFIAVEMGHSDDLMIGEPVIAVGNPVGVGKTVTTGVLSAVGRSIRVDHETEFHDLIQTDAAINPGNSGGALLNIHGQMIGVNTAIIGGTEGLGFAIPVDRVRENVKLLLDAVVERMNLGFTPVAVDGQVTVRSVDPEGAARELLSGDRITAVDGRKVDTVYDFATPLLDKKPGQQVVVRVSRQGEARDVSLTIPLTAMAEYLAQRMGILTAPVPPADRARGVTGVLVTKVLEDSPASRIKLVPGDLITAIGRFRLQSPENLSAILQTAPG